MSKTGENGATFRKGLRDAVRRLAYRTSVDQLKKRGVSRVNVIGMDRIVALIDEAVHRTLRHRLLATERYAVADATKEEFLRLLKSNEELEQARSRAEEELDALRLEQQQLRQQLDERLHQAKAEQAPEYRLEDARIDEQITAVVGSLELPDGDDVAISERLHELVMNVVQKERDEALTAREAARDSELSTLQRRIAKLNQALESTERQIVTTTHQAGRDDGIASIYREVQGLDEQEAHAAQKKELMADIFKANLALQNKS